MTALLAALPVLVAIVVLVLGRPATWAATAALVCAVVVGLLRFRTPAPELWDAAAEYAPLVAEVLLIMLFGMILARLLEASEAMALMARWLQTASTSLPAGTALVVFGVVPFAESVTGYGIGITVGVPILRRLGHSVPRAALLGLLGLIAVPWGALGPGTAVAASLAGLGMDELGQATALVNCVPVLVAVVVVALLCGVRSNPRAAVPVAMAGAVLWTGILGANLLVGTPPAGVLGSLAVIAVLIGFARVRGAAMAVSRPTLSAAVPYAVLTVGLLSLQLLSTVWEEPWIQVLASPPVWLFVACLVAVPTAPGPIAVPAVSLRAARSWIPVGVATGLFMVLGWLMTATGMSQAIGQALAAFGNAPGPLLLALGAILTGSNTGANAMFAGTVASMAEATGASTLILIALSNAAGSFGSLATPPRVALAMQISRGDDQPATSTEPGADVRRDTRQPADQQADQQEADHPADQQEAARRAAAWVQRTAVLIVIAAVVPLAVIAALL